MTLRERYEKETGISWIETGTDGVHMFPIITVPSFEYVNWLESQLEWIPVSEPPKKDGDYLCLTTEPEILYYDAEYREWNRVTSGIFETVYPHHWLPIPPLNHPEFPESWEAS